jgi:hypothetical protein
MAEEKQGGVKTETGEEFGERIERKYNADRMLRRDATKFKGGLLKEEQSREQSIEKGKTKLKEFFSDVLSILRGKGFSLDFQGEQMINLYKVYGEYAVQVTLALEDPYRADDSLARLGEDRTSGEPGIFNLEISSVRIKDPNVEQRETKDGILLDSHIDKHFGRRTSDFSLYRRSKEEVLASISEDEFSSNVERFLEDSKYSLDRTYAESEEIKYGILVGGHYNYDGDYTINFEGVRGDSLSSITFSQDLSLENAKKVFDFALSRARDADISEDDVDASSRLADVVKSDSFLGEIERYAESLSTKK